MAKKFEILLERRSIRRTWPYDRINGINDCYSLHFFKSFRLHQIIFLQIKVETMLPYGFEYMGNMPRMIVTPMTEKGFQ